MAIRVDRAVRRNLTSYEFVGACRLSKTLPRHPVDIVPHDGRGLCGSSAHGSVGN